jgi:outer membrane lipopolysaccharide assembly protein LptE/RlpB
MPQYLFRVCLFSVLTGLSACGYVLQGGGTVLPPDVKNIYIPKVENESTELGLADLVTDALRDQFDSYGAVTVVDKQSQADAVLRVRIVSLIQSVDTVSSTNTTNQMDSTMVLAGELRRVTGKVLWSDSQIRVSKNFATNSSTVVTSSPDFASGSISTSDLSGLNQRELARGQQRQALLTMTDDAARIMYDKAVAPDF